MSEPEQRKQEERGDDKSKPSVILSEAKDLQFVRITTNRVPHSGAARVG
jgi:hypothetical protein